MRIQRVGDRVLSIGSGMQIITPRSAAAAADWWEVTGKTCVAAYQPKGAASYAASLVNLAQPGTYDAAEGVAPTWAAGTGWSFDGTDDYLNSNVVAGDNWSIVVRIVTWTWTAACVLIGSSNTGGVQLTAINQNNADERRYRYGSVATVKFVSGVSTAPGVRAICGTIGYWDGSEDVTGLGGVGNLLPIYIGCLNSDGITTSFAQAVVAAVAIYNSALSAAQIAALTTRMAAL